MKPVQKTYHFKLFKKDISNVEFLQKIRKAISTLPAVYFSFIIVDLCADLTERKIPFFQLTRMRYVKKTQYYSYEIRVNSESNGETHWMMYGKDMQTKKQVLNAFEEICVKRKYPNLSDWNEGFLKSGKYLSDDKKEKLELLKNCCSDYYTKDLPTQIDNILYWESLRYYVDNSNNYIGDQLVSLAQVYCKNGQYEKAKELYERVTFSECATFDLANMIVSGKFGKPNYKLAYEYYRHTCIIDDINYFGAKIEIAKMHRDGKYFKPDYNIYKRIIKTCEKEYLKNGVFDLYSYELYYELALIEQAEDNVQKAIKYCLNAKRLVTERLHVNNVEKIILSAEKIIKLLYTLTDFDRATADFFDLMYIEDKPFKISFLYENSFYEIEGLNENKKLIIRFNGKYYNGLIKFLMKATVGEHLLLHEEMKINIIEVIQ